MRKRAVVTAAAALALVAGGVYVALPSGAAETAAMDYTTAESGNPIFDGWYADPDTGFYNGAYWVYPTSSKSYEEQTYLDAFSSTDLVHWEKHPNIMTTADVSWAKRAVWAPASIQRNGKYYLYFGANDIQNNNETGGIGVAVADKPEGPYKDAIGKPLIGAFHNGAQPIDQDVFVDDDGQAYMYYGGWGHANVVKLNADMTSLGTFPDGSTYKEITPDGYTEGPQMFKRNGKYYLMWSEGGWTGPDYAVSYAIADSPLGPFRKQDRILEQDSEVARGSGHNGVINVPGTDIWYIIYHRRPLSETDGNHREVSYDRMVFNADGTIQKVKMLVKDNFEDGNALGWGIYGGAWKVGGGTFNVDSAGGGKAMLDTNFGDVVLDADVKITGGQGNGDAGVVFRATALGNGIDTYKGYYAGLRPAGNVVLGKAANNWTQLAVTGMKVETGKTYHLRVRAVGSDLKVYVDDMDTPKISVTDSTYSSGADGVRTFYAEASFDNISVARP